MSKWKYGMLSADERIELLRKGKKDVLEEEVERTREVVKARRELGLGTEEQEKWLDTVGYNYNVAHAQRVGEDVGNVATTGYAQLYLKDSGGKSASGSTGSLGTVSGSSRDTSSITSVSEYKNKAHPGSTQITNAKRKIERAGELAAKAIEGKYAEKRAELEDAFYGDNPYVREAVLNSGGHDDGGKMAKAYNDLASELGVALDGTSDAMERELEASRKKYAGLVDTLLGYRKNGAAKESLDTIANVLIKNAALEDGYDHSPVTGDTSRKRKKNDTVSSEKSDAEGNVARGRSKPMVRSEAYEPVAADKDASKKPEVETVSEPNSVTESLPSENDEGLQVKEAISEILEIARDGDIIKASEILARLGGLGVETAKRILTLVLGRE